MTCLRVPWLKAGNEHEGFGKWTSDVRLEMSDLPAVRQKAAAA